MLKTVEGAVFTQVRAEGDQVQNRSAEPVQAGDDDGVPGAGDLLQYEIELRAGGLRDTYLYAIRLLKAA